MFNLTPHAITVLGPDGVEHLFTPSGVVARVATNETVIGHCLVTGAPIVERTFGEPHGLPTEGTPCIVSAMVASACAGRAGVFAPDSGETAVRDERGLVVAVTRLVAA